MSKLRNWVPAAEWMANYKKADLRGDFIAGITVAMLLIPQGMSYALLAGLPPYIGLYASVIPVLIYAMFGTSRQLAVGPAAMVALLVSSGVGGIAGHDTTLFVALAILLSLMVGAIQLGMGLFRLGFLTNFMSHPVISGFTSAAGLIIGFSQLKHLVGLPIPRSENIFEIAYLTLTQLSNINLAALGIGLGGIILLLLMKRYTPKLPGAMVVLLISTIAVAMFDLDTRFQLDIVGSIPAGFPAFSIPIMNIQSVQQLLPIAITISFVGFLESFAIAKKIAAEKRYEINPNKELIGLGLANIGGAFFKAMPVTGGFARTAVNSNAGANTALASIITAVLIGISLVFFTPTFYYIPKAILAAIIMVAVTSLIDVNEVGHLWKVKKEDLVMLVIAFLATLFIGVKSGIFVAVAISMIWFVVRTTRPHFAVLGQIPGTAVYRNIKRHPEATQLDGVLAIRFDSQFYYGNVSFLKETLKREEARMQSPLTTVVLDASAVNQLDSSADTALHDILRDFQERDIKLIFANVKGPVMDVMKHSHFIDKLGEENFFLTIAEAMAAAKENIPFRN